MTYPYSPNELLKLLGAMARRKVFVSYYHAQDERYRWHLQQHFSHLFIFKSVQPGDIAIDNTDAYIAELIRQDFISDSSVVLVLVGPNTYKRKHVDWEIAAGLDPRVGGARAGLLAVMLPEFQIHLDPVMHRAYGTPMPPRLDDNLASGYASLFSWSTLVQDETTMRDAVNFVFERRTRCGNLARNGRYRMDWNLP